MTQLFDPQREAAGAAQARVWISCLQTLVVTVSVTALAAGLIRDVVLPSRSPSDTFRALPWILLCLCQQLGCNLACAVAKAGALLFGHALASCLLWRLLLLGKIGSSVITALYREWISGVESFHSSGFWAAFWLHSFWSLCGFGHRRSFRNMFVATLYGLIATAALAACGVLGPVAASMVDPCFTTPIVLAWVTAGDVLAGLWWSAGVICSSLIKSYMLVVYLGLFTTETEPLSLLYAVWIRRFRSQGVWKLAKHVFRSSTFKTACKRACILVLCLAGYHGYFGDSGAHVIGRIWKMSLGHPIVTYSCGWLWKAGTLMLFLVLMYVLHYASFIRSRRLVVAGFKVCKDRQTWVAAIGQMQACCSGAVARIWAAAKSPRLWRHFPAWRAAVSHTVAGWEMWLLDMTLKGLRLKKSILIYVHSSDWAALTHSELITVHSRANAKAPTYSCYLLQPHAEVPTHNAAMGGAKLPNPSPISRGFAVHKSHGRHSHLSSVGKRGSADGSGAQNRTHLSFALESPLSGHPNRTSKADVTSLPTSSSTPSSRRNSRSSSILPAGFSQSASCSPAEEALESHSHPHASARLSNAAAGPGPAATGPAPGADSPAPAADVSAPAADVLAPTAVSPAPAADASAPAADGPAPASDHPAPAGLAATTNAAAVANSASSTKHDSSTALTAVKASTAATTSTAESTSSAAASDPLKDAQPHAVTAAPQVSAAPPASIGPAAAAVVSSAASRALAVNPDTETPTAADASITVAATAAAAPAAEAPAGAQVPAAEAPSAADAAGTAAPAAADAPSALRSKTSSADGAPVVKVHAAAGHLTTSEGVASDAKALDSGKHKRRQAGRQRMRKLSGWLKRKMTCICGTFSRGQVKD